jgi:hypothetical protein
LTEYIYKDTLVNDYKDTPWFSLDKVPAKETPMHLIPDDEVKHVEREEELVRLLQKVFGLWMLDVEGRERWDAAFAAAEDSDAKVRAFDEGVERLMGIIRAAATLGQMAQKATSAPERVKVKCA